MMILFWLFVVLLTLGVMSLVLYPFYRVSLAANTKTIIVLLLLVPIFSISLYFYWGNSKKLAEWLTVKDRAAEVRAQVEKFGSRQKIITALENRLQNMPNNKNTAHGLSILAKLYMSNHDLPKAAATLRKANTMDPNSVEIMMQLALVKFYINDNHLDDEARTLLLQVLRKIPTQPEAINLLALDSYEHKNYPVAIRYWEKLLPLFNPDSSDGKNLLMMIRQAQLANTSQKVYLDVNVNLSGFDREKISHQYVFIYALAEKGSRVPLAVIRKSVADLPCTVRLDDTRSMLADHLLSKEKNVIVYARASKSGTAMTQKGDLIGKSKVIDATKEHQVQVTINKLVNVMPAKAGIQD